jgi:hypothetical protein
MLAVLAATTLSACSTYAEPPTARALPPAPDFAKPADVAQPRKGESAVNVAARERAGRIAANGRIKAFRDWYEGVREDYAK